MKVHCSQELLKQTLAACTALERACPEITQVCLTAKASSPERPGGLEVFAWWNAGQTVGLMTRLPAQVESAGQVVVRVKSVAEGLASAHPGQVTLSLVEVEPPVKTPVAKQERIKALKGGPALQIESACTSARGTVSTRRIRIRLSPSQQEAPVMVVPDVAFWRATGVRRAEVAPAQLRTALASCLSLARQRAASSELFPDMNHALVLVRFDAAHLQWTATTRSNVVGWHLPLPTPALPMPYTHALFDERVLTWICAALVGVKRPVKLTLVPQAQKQVLLLVESAHM